jgi:hypothetical protein
MSHRPHPLDQVELRFGLGGAVLVVLLLGVRATGLPEAAALTVLLLATTALAALVDLPYAALLGLTAWALFTGFVSHGDGVLGLAASDLRVLALLLGTALTATLVARRPHPLAARSSGHPHRQVRAHVSGRAA